MPCSSLYFLIDELGGFWNLSVTNGGLVVITLTVTPATPPVPFISLQDSTIAQTWQITVRSIGTLVLTGTPVLPPPPLFLGITSPNGSLYRLRIFNGALQTVLQPPSIQPVPIVGTIFQPAVSYLSPFTQPGGPGTATFPQQDPGQMIGLFVAGCGHFFNSWIIFSATVNCDQVAAMLCPVCGYCQRLIDPYSDIHSFQHEILLA